MKKAAIYLNNNIRNPSIHIDIDQITQTFYVFTKVELS